MRPDIEKQLERIIKTPKEISILKRSAAITDSCIDVLERKLKKDVNEKELAAAIDRNIRKHGAKNAFPTIVTCGKRGVCIHPKPSIKRVRGIGYADFGAMYKGYRTDITVPFVKGEIGKKEERMIDTIMQMSKLAVKSAKPGVYCWKLQEMFERFISKRGYKVCHYLGHGIGLDIHELPSLAKPRKGRKMTKKGVKRWKIIKSIRFKPGMVFTIEPGVYVKGVGGCRYENDFLMTKAGAKPITHSRLIRLK